MRISSFLLCIMTIGCGNVAPTPPPVVTTTPATGSGSPNSVSDQSKVSVPKPNAQVDAKEPWGTVRGRIVWGSDDLPAALPVVVKKDHPDFNFCCKKGPIPAEEWLVDRESKGLKDTFVWLAPTDKEGKLEIHPKRQAIPKGQEQVVMDQPVCAFVPHALAMREEQVLVVKNSASVLHNFNWSGSQEINAGDNKAIEPGGIREYKIKADPRLIMASCIIHPWMKASILCVDHPYYAVTDAQGRFEIKDAPAGPCRLMIRHSTGLWLGGAAGKNGRPLTIEPGDNDLGSLDYPPPKN